MSKVLFAGQASSVLSTIVKIWSMNTINDDRWQPVTNTEWAAFASLYIMTVNADTLAITLDWLPAGMDSTISAGWICDAAESAARYYEGKHRR